jgi:hypothetical protein
LLEGRRSEVGSRGAGDSDLGAKSAMGSAT